MRLIVIFTLIGILLPLGLGTACFALGTETKQWFIEYQGIAWKSGISAGFLGAVMDDQIRSRFGEG